MRAVIFVLVLVTSGCRHEETIPVVTVSPNSSGIVETGFELSEPQYMFGGPIKNADRPNDPYFPPGVSTYVLPAALAESGDIDKASYLRILSLEGDEYRDIPKRMEATLKDGTLQNEDAGHHFEVLGTNAGRCFVSKKRFVEFPWGTAGIYLTSYIQGKTGCQVNNNDLAYIVQGFTKDGRYLVDGKFMIAHPQLPEHCRNREGDPTDRLFFDYDESDSGAQEWLDAQPDDSFYPTFESYKEFLEAFKILPGSPYKPPGQ